MLEFWYGHRRTCSLNRSASRVPHALGWIGALSMFFDPNHTNFPAGSVIWLAAPSSFTFHTPDHLTFLRLRAARDYLP